MNQQRAGRLFAPARGSSVQSTTYKQSKINAIWLLTCAHVADTVLVMKLTKQTSTGEAVIEVINGLATATINGQSTGSTSGMVQTLKPFGPNNEFVGGICKIALTKEEAAEVSKMLAHREPAPAPQRDLVYEQEQKDKRFSRFIASDGGVL